MMKQGERQVSPTIDGIRRDHSARYEWVANNIPPNSTVIDFACGIGYGGNIMASMGHLVKSYDIDKDALAYGEKYYKHPNLKLLLGDGNDPRDLPEADFAVSFETIEHIKDPRNLLRAFHKSTSRLIASVPNEAVMPWRREDGATTAFHFRHYTKEQFNNLLIECGWIAREWYGQAGPESEVEPNVDGRTLIAVCERFENYDTEPVETSDVQLGTGKHIAILGLGPSVDQYLELTKRAGGRSNYCDETWSINALGDVFASDLIFHMDDVRIQDIRAQAKPDSNIAGMLKWLKTSPTPVVTSRTHPDYPNLHKFPLESVLNHLGHDYFNSTAAYAIAYAIHVGVAKITLFGMDFTYPNTHDAEKGRACVEFWLGQAHARGVIINLPKTTTLMDSCYPQSARLYGYDTLDIEFNVHPDGELKLKFTERDTLPTAEEIEANYDHSKPVSEQHLSTKE